MHLHCEATQTTNTIIIEHHIERQTMNGVVSRRAVQQRMRHDRMCDQIERFDRS